MYIFSGWIWQRTTCVLRFLLPLWLHELAHSSYWLSVCFRSQIFPIRSIFLTVLSTARLCIDGFPVWNIILKAVRITYQEDKFWWECREKGPLGHCWWKRKLEQLLVWCFLKKLKSTLAICPRNPSSGYIAKGNEIIINTSALTSFLKQYS